MEIHVITPIVTEGFRPPDDLAELQRPGVTLSHSSIESGPASIESDYDDVLAGPGTIARGIEAYRNGADAIVIDCFGDIAIPALREAVPIPVLGPGEVSMHLATTLGHSYSVVAVLTRVIRRIENRARLYGVHERLVSVRSAESPVLELERDRTSLGMKLGRVAEQAVREDGASVVILGCTGMLHAARQVSEHLTAQGLDVPVIEPLSSAIAQAEMLVRLGLRHSGRSYQRPPAKEIRGYAAPLLHEVAAR
jgi:allantoin racemase